MHKRRRRRRRLSGSKRHPGRRRALDREFGFFSDLTFRGLMDGRRDQALMNWLTGFGLATRASREHQDPDPPKMIGGALAYMAPEQTGRMNRATDSRSDLYGLGVVLYEMLTGAPPFTASDPMELIHCHIARQPAPPSDRAGRRGACHGWAGSVLLRHVRDLLGVDERFVVRLGLWRRRLGLPADATRTFGARPPLRLLGFSQLTWVLEPALHRHAVFG